MANKKQETPQTTNDDMMTETETTSEQKPMLQLGGLWVNESKDGKTKYMTGYLGNLRIMIFRNNYKSESKHPDYVMYLAEQDHKKDEKSEEKTQDDIPF